MAWQNPNCIVHAMQSIRRTAQLRTFLQTPNVSPLRTNPTSILSQQRKHVRGYATETLTEVPAAPELTLEDFQKMPARVVPVSPAYFSGSPKFIDHLLKLENILAKWAALPTVPSTEAPRMAWFKLTQFRDFVGESVPTKKYKNLVKILQRLNRIDPKLMPGEVRKTLTQFLRPGNPYANKPTPATVDEMGRSRGKGKRKTSSAVVHLVEGEGEVMVNGKTLIEAFPRLHDRESATWPLRCTSRLDKYNVWASVRGGGVTGQAEATTLALARALLVHEPGLKPVLRKAGVITVDARRVERKKPGHVKARKMPTWVKR
ncbi:ribosomal protein S5 domain 2-type protein [Aspergillus avenaceus]|uniref:Small ribosomal subunit protein uS9m n=1 Tax=Aspergillus avenaceus TaxID=36643 RepID=A0A5N6TEJ2_ASPAV|nr:ribosomal protein S5 domain 2-type protein [Aspergillus avenaceus]